MDGDWWPPGATVSAHVGRPGSLLDDSSYALLFPIFHDLPPPRPGRGEARRSWSIVASMAVKLHRCSTKWKVGPCWRVQKALDEQGIDYEVVKGPARPGKRVDLQRLSAQNLYPVIEFENGSIYREESKDMAATIRAGKLDEKRGAAS